MSSTACIFLNGAFWKEKIENPTHKKSPGEGHGLDVEFSYKNTSYFLRPSLPENLDFRTSPAKKKPSRIASNE